jgi:NADPH-dependent 2,4-dienoyl-CoA reductase/sulfur reductase-like enzyme
VRCPWHHACFDLASGEALGAPALDPVPCWRVEEKAGRAYVREKIVAPPRSLAAGKAPREIVIVGGGAAGLAAAERLRREGYAGKLTMVSADSAPPSDRPNLSKDYLAGNAPEEWIPLRGDDWYRERNIDLRLGTRVERLDLAGRRVQLAGGDALGYDALLLATGAEPARIDVPGAEPERVLTLRSLADSRAIIARAASAKRVVVIGASFIGLEVAASLRARKLEVHVVAPDQVPMQKVMGDEVGRFVQGLHEAQGVQFHLGATVKSVDHARVKLTDGTAVEADFIVMGVGVRPALALAEQAGLAVDRGVTVDEYLQTSQPGVYAAGDIARWPDPHSGQRIRVEHWVVAERQGQVAAQNMLGLRRRYDVVPFFWSAHYDVTIAYVGHAERHDRIVIDGSLEARDCAVRYELEGKTLAVATIGRDMESLRTERAMELAA